MLSPDDAAIAERDRALPGLATILDAEAMRQIVQGLSGNQRIVRFRPEYVRYKPRTSCIVGYSVEVNSSRIPMYARTHGAGARVKLAKAIHREGHAGVLGFGTAAVRNRDLVIFEAPNDDELRGLAKLFRVVDGGLRGAAVTLGEHSIEGARVIPLRYKPERRFVARLTQPSASFVIKVYDSDDFEAIRKRGKQFASAGALVVAEPVGHRTRHCALLFDWIDGATVIDLAARGSPEGVAAATNLGESLREIHRHSPSKAIPKCDMECLSEWVTREMNALDDVVERSPACEIADRIMARLTGHAWGKTGLHGDFSHDQAIIRNRQAVVFDFDRAMRGDPWIDLGRFIASLELEVIRGRIDAAARDALTHGFLVGYGEGSFDESHVGNAFVALQILVRAQEPFRLRWPDWRCASERIVARARHLAEDKRCASR